MGASKITKPKLEQAALKATMAEGLHTGRGQWQCMETKKINGKDRNMMIISNGLHAHSSKVGVCSRGVIPYSHCANPIEPLLFPMRCCAIFVLSNRKTV